MSSAIQKTQYHDGSKVLGVLLTLELKVVHVNGAERRHLDWHNAHACMQQNNIMLARNETRQKHEKGRVNKERAQKRIKRRQTSMKWQKWDMSAEVVPHMVAVAGLVPCADTGIRHTSRWYSPLYNT